MTPILWLRTVVSNECSFKALKLRNVYSEQSLELYSYMYKEENDIEEEHDDDVNVMMLMPYFWHILPETDLCQQGKSIFVFKLNIRRCTDLEFAQKRFH